MRPHIFSNKILTRNVRIQVSDEEKSLVHRAIRRHDTHFKPTRTELLFEDLWGMVFRSIGDGPQKKKGVYIVRLTLNLGLWGNGDSVIADDRVFFKLVDSGLIDDIWEYGLFFSPTYPEKIFNLPPEGRKEFAPHFGAMFRTVFGTRKKIELPSQDQAYNDFFSTLAISENLPEGARKAFDKNSPISKDGLSEISELLYRDFQKTICNLPPVPDGSRRDIGSLVPCFGPIDPNYVFYNPYPVLMPTMFPHMGDPYVDLSINCALLNLPYIDVANSMFVGEKMEQSVKHVRHLSRELWQPALVSALVNRSIVYAFGSYPDPALTSSTTNYFENCRPRIRNSLLKSHQKGLDSFLLKGIID